MNLAKFEPARTRAALARVRKAHIHTSATPAGFDDDFLDTLRRKLRGDSLARSRSPAEVRGCLHLLSRDQDEQILNRAASVIETRARPDLLRPAWVLLRNHYPAPNLEETIRYLGNKVGWQRSTKSEEEAQHFRRWFSRDSLPNGLLVDFQEDADSSLAVWLEDREIDGRSGLETATWNSALRGASTRLIDQIGHRELLDRATRCESLIQSAFSLNYLLKVTPERWISEVVSWIEKRFGKPPRSEEGLSPFWRQIDAETRRVFRRYAVEGTLRDFFDSVQDPHGRFQFWRGFLDHIEDAEAFLDHTVAIIDFGKFGVVEFGNVGNAAYVYGPEPLAAVWRGARSARHPADFKDREATLRRPHPGPAGDGRMIHHEGWQARYGAWIRRLLGV